MSRLVSPALLIALVISLCISSTSAAVVQEPAPSKTARLHGRVVDARTGEPVAKVRVIVSGTDLSTTTDDNGEFTFDSLPAGAVQLYITTVTFGLVKKTITVAEGNNPDFEIALNENAAALTEKVTITTGPFERVETNAASEQGLNERAAPTRGEATS